MTGRRNGAGHPCSVSVPNVGVNMVGRRQLQGKMLPRSYPHKSVEWGERRWASAGRVMGGSAAAWTRPPWPNSRDRRRARQSNRDSGNALGEWIKSTRLAQGVSQREIADRAGLSRSYVCDIEHGRSSKPSFECLERIAKALGVDRTDVLRMAGILDPVKAPEENIRERKHLSVYQSLNEANRTAVEAFARYLLSQEQHWVQVKLVDGDRDPDLDSRQLQNGPTLFDIVEIKE